MKKFVSEDEFDLILTKKNRVAESAEVLPPDDLVEKYIGKIQTYELKRTRQETLPDPIDEIKKVMRRRGLTKKDLMACIGSSGNVCDILARRRPLSLRMIRNLHNFLGISAEILIQPYEYARR